jgi:hypothetical protein
MRSVGECRPNSKNPRYDTGTWGTPGGCKFSWAGTEFEFWVDDRNRGRI